MTPVLKKILPNFSVHRNLWFEEPRILKSNMYTVIFIWIMTNHYIFACGFFLFLFLFLFFFFDSLEPVKVTVTVTERYLYCAPVESKGGFYGIDKTRCGYYGMLESVQACSTRRRGWVSELTGRVIRWSQTKSVTGLLKSVHSYSTGRRG